jgi:hypothetical protein
MNRFMNEKWAWHESSHGMRDEALATLTDADLAFNPGGQNLTLGALFREMGEIEYSYIQSLKTFKQNWDYHNSEVGNTVAGLQAWFKTLDAEMKDAISAFSDEDLSKTVERESGYQMPIELQMDGYLQAMMIFFGKLSVTLKAMSKPLTQAMKDWIW